LRTLIIGAGPFGLALSAYARAHGIEHTVVGRHMDFWKQHMPAEMLLRSRCDWHLDPLEEHTIEHYLETLGLQPADVEPLSLRFYLDYCDWFTKEKEIEIDDSRVDRLDIGENGSRSFIATLGNGATIAADRVVVAVGFGYFANVPDHLRSMLPDGRFSHTSELSDFSRLNGKRVLIVGGRQSAFAWAALIHERGAKAIHLCYRHATPSFEESDWSWVAGCVHNIATQPGWFRKLPSEERDRINHRQWAEGRLKLEPVFTRSRRDVEGARQLAAEQRVTHGLADIHRDVALGLIGRGAHVRHEQNVRHRSASGRAPVAAPGPWR